jgi:hypothetical protein
MGNPIWLFGGFLGFLARGFLLLMGAVFAPLLFLFGFWVVAIVRGIRQSNLVWRYANLALAGVLLYTLPVSYSRPRVFDSYGKQHPASKGSSRPQQPTTATRTPDDRQAKNPASAQ